MNEDAFVILRNGEPIVMVPLSDELLDRLDHAIDSTLLEHGGDDNRCSCGGRNNMDGDVLHSHRVSVMSDAIRRVLGVED